jgi:serine/threonine protein kinase
MAIDPTTEARFFGRLAVKGILTTEAVQGLFRQAAEAADAGRKASLSSLAVRGGLIDGDRLTRLFRTDAEDVPDIAGHAYERKLGEGGTALVFAVRRQKDGARLAVKILHPHIAEDPTEVKAFLDEARMLKTLDHPNVVKATQAGRLAGRYMSFMECVDGRTLQEIIGDGGALEEDAALYVVLQVARALEYLRGHGIVHRDIKPGNILLVPETNDVKVIDLGFAIQSGGGADGADGSGADGESQGTTRGTAAYLSPEQARGEADLDVRSDIYALGATLYQLVLGELPFSGDDEAMVQAAVLEGLSAEATKGGRISAPMHYFIEKMMAKDRAIRYQDPQELIADIERQIEGKKSQDFDAGDGGEDERIQKQRLARLRRRRKKR